ncbi:MAG: tRNA pseudouridine synthase B [Alphaproteobacteria bacterium MarineAlpha5_Bin11]|nr:tRNA pseudouridine(55) synthase TruB [Pelagibacteraceae bacterium]PPR45152.1 MAG: tRNA pseudouridine synthase B [Alphaproteobacteria bacterium MarineAlpha5_Bin11]PPR52124.1 MAG: tRNA pseudouridine synthase B [Alphaproteobacteria bacterium MarineAlpha5_Bin10]|tara:strand:+ start:17152 stop:18057 length:906 start_codon:yes stop_codon:yes gene_type:complete
MNLITKGWISVNKPINLSSSETVLRIKKKFRLSKVGHAGTLDPLARGILPIAFGSTTKLISFVMDSRKEYNFTIKWGSQTDTDDSEGKVISESNKIPSKKEIIENLSHYVGSIYQRPPNFSAIKVDGKRAYRLSKQNVDFDLPKRMVCVYSLNYLNNINDCESSFNIECGKGFYIRSFARDLGSRLSTFGHITSLERVKVGIFNNKNTILLDDLLKISHLSSHIKGYYPSAVVLDDIPALTVKNGEDSDIRMGKKINVSFLSDLTLKKFNSKKYVYAKNKYEVVALGFIKNNFFVPKKVLN